MSVTDIDEHPGLVILANEYVHARENTRRAEAEYRLACCLVHGVWPDRGTHQAISAAPVVVGFHAVQLGKLTADDLDDWADLRFTAPDAAAVKAAAEGMRILGVSNVDELYRDHYPASDERDPYPTLGVYLFNTPTEDS